jgi:phosphoglycerate kinase
MEKEFKTLTGLLEFPSKPFFAVIGGAKISTKIEVIKKLVKKADVIFIGGAMANTFLQAQGFDVEKSLTEPELVDTAREIIELSKNKKVDLILPTDLVVAKAVKTGANKRTVEVGKLEKGDIALDIGKETMRSLIPIIKKAKTIFWNGTLGYAELYDYALASKDLAYLMALRRGKAETVIGGGDTTAFVEKLGMHNRYSFVSTGGGASLELLSGKQLPALEALKI